MFTFSFPIGMEEGRPLIAPSPSIHQNALTINAAKRNPRHFAFNNARVSSVIATSAPQNVKWKLSFVPIDGCQRMVDKKDYVRIIVLPET